MKTRNVILGVAFIGVGLALLAENFGLWEISFEKIAPFWPIMWILAGLFAWFDPHKRVMNGATTLLLIMSIPLIFYAQALKVRPNFDWDQWDSDEVEEEISSSKTYQSFQVPNDESVELANFSITSGLGEYKVEASEKALFSAEMKGRHRQMKMTDGLENGVYQIQLTESEKEKSKGRSSDLLVRFHPRPVWDMAWEVGLGEVDLDLKDFKIRDLSLSAGLAEVKLKIGTLQKETKIQLKSGLADTKISIPEQAGAEIRTESALSSFDFEGFDEVEKGVYRTANFAESKQKVWIEIESGFASVEVKRYN